eukprot:403372196
MPNEKQTGALQSKLQSLIKALQRCGQQNPDIDTNPSYIRILEEVKENLKDIAHYIEDFRGRTALRKNIANYTRLIESLALIKSQNSNQYEEMSEEIKDENFQQDPNQNREHLSTNHEKKLQAKIQEFEDKLKMFLRQQSQMEESDFNQYEYAQRISLIENGAGKKTGRRIQNQNSSQERFGNEKENYQKQNFQGPNKVGDLNLNRALSEEMRSPNRFNKGQEYCLEAHCLLYGHGIEPNTEIAIVWYERSANLGEPRAIFSLGKLYEEGIGVKIDLPKAISYYLRAAELGEPSAQYRLAKYYQVGGNLSLNEGKPDASKAFELYQSSALENQKEAMREVGFIYEKGGMIEGEKPGKFILLVDKDSKKALEYYQKAANLGDELAMNFIGSYYFNHTKDFDKAFKYFRQACQSGKCERAFNNLAHCFEQGVGEAIQDYHTAIRLYEQSALNGYHQALVNLAFLYYKIAASGQHLDELDTSELYFQCAQALRKALINNENNYEANFLMAKLYEEGLSVDHNPILAQKYYQKAAELGYSKALTKLGHLYYSSILNVKDEDLVTPYDMTLDVQNRLKSMEYYEQASKQGDSEASNCLGLIYESGLGSNSLTADLNKAQEYYKIAIDQNKNNLDAIFNLGLLLFNAESSQQKTTKQIDGNIEENTLKSNKGFELIQKAAEQGYLRAKEFIMISQMQTITNNFTMNTQRTRMLETRNNNDFILIQSQSYQVPTQSNEYVNQSYDYEINERIPI